MRGRRPVLALLALAVLLAMPSSAHAGGSGIRLRSNVTKEDNWVGARVSLGGFPNESCAGRIRKAGRSASAGAVRTSPNGGAVWSWLIPSNVSAGYWTFSVICTGGRHEHRASTTFLAERGTGRRSRGLWIKESLHARPVIQPRDETGNGGGGGSLYPFGQSTWWVARQRPDLPFFPGRSGDALNWAKSAKAHGFPVGSAPKVGAVAVFQPGQYGAGRFGHVAIVVAVLGNKIRISEAGFRGPGRRDERTIGAKGLRFIYEKGNPAPSLNATLIGPTENQRVQGTVTVSASSNAPAIRFAVYSYSNPALPESGQWETIGDDATPADGFTATWDTTQTPNQGGDGRATVIVSAIVLGEDGAPTGAESHVTVAVANSRTVGGRTYFPYYLVGTCQEGECGLAVHSGPGQTKYPTIGEKRDGEEVDVVCQSYGETFVSRLGGTSSVWDRLTNGGWVSDYYVDTPERGVPSPPIPLCP